MKGGSTHTTRKRLNECQMSVGFKNILEEEDKNRKKTTRHIIININCETLKQLKYILGFLYFSYIFTAILLGHGDNYFCKSSIGVKSPNEQDIFSLFRSHCDSSQCHGVVWDVFVQRLRHLRLGSNGLSFLVDLIDDTDV